MTRRRELEQQVAGLETARRLAQERVDELTESLRISRHQHQQASERAVDLERQLAALQARYDAAVELDHPDIAAAGARYQECRATVTTLQERGPEQGALPRRTPGVTVDEVADNAARFAEAMRAAEELPTPREVYEAQVRAVTDSALRNSA
ncbi:hypothetical protein [Streptomyces lonarensis]|uniref:Uncharacterized protein n=1 Tax=Streptomyces lonarensis TaxID=700599 RepID=A0A7X6CXG7_9ACTN|nr:hypothetical protein [Streptomyces lonarensis]NJQ04240.1 hypothetical protein [Streptomyces lonarensis]